MIEPSPASGGDRGPLDCVYQQIVHPTAEIEHRYGGNYHILADPFLLSHLARLCTHDVVQPLLNNLVRDLYRYLIKAILNAEFPRCRRSFDTRMRESSPLGIWTGEVIDTETRAVTVNIARAGTLPSQVVFDFLCTTMNPARVRQDHIVMARATTAEGRVTGSDVHGLKIGGDVENAIVIFPDPMGATGGSLVAAIDIYKKDFGRAAKYVTANLIVTPEYLRRMQRSHPDVIVYAVRLDRGASPAAVLADVPGSRWNEESGLTERGYIVPGGGGFGEIMNNTDV
ncbi:MAG: uracil phosphoribosyltransferase [Deltaproteobacteria bacterium]|nr:uracil phosphoribosyltransferase [Deltaproteobacteria bacterium]